MFFPLQRAYEAYGFICLIGFVLPPKKVPPYERNDKSLTEVVVAKVTDLHIVQS